MSDVSITFSELFNTELDSVVIISTYLSADVDFLSAIVDLLTAMTFSDNARPFSSLSLSSKNLYKRV